LVVAGPLRESAFVLDGEEVQVGRDPCNRIPISDPALSRRHCLLRREEGTYKLQDLGSRNGTYVNGVTIQEAQLNHGDQITVGNSILVYSLREAGVEPVTGPVEFDDGLTRATAQIRPQDTVYLHPERILSELSPASRLGRNLNALLKISQAVQSIPDLEQLQEEILERLFEVVPAEHGAILLDGRGGERFSSVFARHRVEQREEAVRVSRTITRRVLEQGVAVLGADVPGSDGLGSVDGLASFNIRSLLCVPLTVFHKVIGCIYLDTTDSSDRFDKEHLELVTGIAGISSVALENARRLQWLEQENLRLTTEMNLQHNMVGESARMKEVYQFLSRVAPTDSNVLIAGESGTGKELAARAIHRNSPRASRPFVAINCAAIPEGLLESELFGHERGAFTGAIGQKKGRLEMADGGVIFLDEIGDLAPALQAKLLRVLQEREFERLGGTHTIFVDVRVIAATNQNLEAAVKARTFREDLYYRLNVVSLVMPPLRERREDIPLLTEQSVTKFAAKCKLRPKQISSEAMAYLVNYNWPGNVRELENAVERALVLSLSDQIKPEDLPTSVLYRNPAPGVHQANYQTALNELRKHLILSAMEEGKGSFTEAAGILGVHPNYLHRLVRKLGLRGSLAALAGSQSGGSRASAGSA
jgi:Nif-specific regulatory protein